MISIPLKCFWVVEFICNNFHKFKVEMHTMEKNGKLVQQ